MAATKRSLNKCVDCKHTWYPKGKDLSVRCPECASTNVKYAGIGLLSRLGIGVLVFAVFLVLPGKEKSSIQPTSSDVASEINSSSIGSGITEHSSNISSNEDVSVHTQQISASDNGTNGPDRSRRAEGKNPDPSALQMQFIEDKDRVYSDDEILQMEIAKQYQGDDPIVRRRLQLPSRETKKLIP